MTRILRPTLIALLAATVVGPTALVGQGAVPGSPPVVKYGKWVAFGTSIVFGLLAQSEHRAADAAFQDLTTYCLDDATRCDLDAGGHYIDPVSERYYQTSLSHDRRAGHWLLGGEALFIGAAAALLWELTLQKGLPADIPLAPVVEPRADGLRVGGSFRF